MQVTIVDKEILEKYKGRIVGILQDDSVLVQSSYAHKNSIAIGSGGLNPVMLKCKGCGKSDNSIALPGRVSRVKDASVENDYNVEFQTVYSPVLCPECAAKEIMKYAAKLVCNGCDKQVAWLEAGTTDDGKKIEAGNIYHTARCPNCSEEEQIQILDL